MIGFFYSAAWPVMVCWLTSGCSSWVPAAADAVVRAN
jgi:hypothetical protein